MQHPLATIGLVDDDQNILVSVTMALEEEGFKVCSFHDAIEALNFLTKQRVDLVVLDIKMPRLDGIELLSRIRRSSDIPAIFLTSKGDEVDEVLGLKVGADDYIRKPFSHRLLIERIRAVLRRSDSDGSRDLDSSIRPMVRGNLILDLARHSCAWKGSEVRLTVTEFLILKALVTRPGFVKSRDQLMDAAYEENIYVDDRTIDSHIKRLRRKLREVDPEFSGIETLYGVGYRYCDT